MARKPGDRVARIVRAKSTKLAFRDTQRRFKVEVSAGGSVGSTCGDPKGYSSVVGEAV